MFVLLASLGRTSFIRKQEGKAARYSYLRRYVECGEKRELQRDSRLPALWSCRAEDPRGDLRRLFEKRSNVFFSWHEMRMVDLCWWLPHGGGGQERKEKAYLMWRGKKKDVVLCSFACLSLSAQACFHVIVLSVADYCSGTRSIDCCCGLIIKFFRS